MIETVRVSEKAKLQLMTIKKRTKIKNWNIVCRWAFLLSLKDKSVPAPEDIPSDSNVEMTWRTFTGTYDKLYLSLLIKRLNQDNIKLSRENILRYFKIHLHRGISFLSGTQYKNIDNYLSLINDHYN